MYQARTKETHKLEDKVSDYEVNQLHFFLLYL